MAQSYEDTVIKESVLLPQAFLKRMQAQLGEEYPAFLAAYEKKRLYGLRYNPLKTDKETFLKKMPFFLSPIEWAEEGFYYRPEEQPGKHVFHEAGAYYIQEPSAMAVAEVLAPKAGECILDLCAAPGGKSTQIAGKMMGEGLLITNEIISGRAKILSQNIERMGIGNAVVCNETPNRLADRFPGFFDRILVDAPCSGEGMFRKDETAIKEWSPQHVKMCADRQLSILEQAALMLKAGGILVYSTCTFSEEENEGVISTFADRHEEFTIERTMRLWPHKIEGEGHFIAELKKAKTSSQDAPDETVYTKTPHNKKKEKDKKSAIAQAGQLDKEALRICRSFLQETLGAAGRIWDAFEENGEWVAFGEQIYLAPKEMTQMSGLKILRPGLHLGSVTKNRFEPSHALALYLPPEAVNHCYEMTEKQAAAYLRGETLACDAALKGWMLLTIDGFGLGFGKAGGGMMKNHYPKGLRKDIGI